ncbi:MAG: spermine synthase, partial [Planctomycetaceae bacterium]
IVAGMTAGGVCLHGRFRPRPLMISAAWLTVIVGLWHQAWNENLLYLGHTAFHSTENLKEAREDLQHPQRFKGNRDVFAINWIDGRPYFFINGYLSIPLSSPSEKIVGAFSSVFAPRNDRALVLGVGSGATAGTTGLLFDNVDAVEINPVVLENLDRMSEFSFDIRNNKQVRIIQDDAIHFAKSSSASYSLIINTVTTPLYFSSSKLYTRDFLDCVRQRLSPGGVYVTWVDSRVGDRGLDIVLKTISESFEHCAMGCVKSSYFLLLCSADPIQVRQPTLVADNPRLREYFLAEHGIVPSWLPYGLLLENAFVLRSDTEVATNTLDFPVLEFEMARLRQRGIAEFKKRLRSHMSVAESRNSLAGALDWDPHRLLFHVRELLGDSSITDRWATLVQRESIGFEMGLKQADAEYHRIRSEYLQTADARHKYGYRLMQIARYNPAIAEFQRVLKLDSQRDNTHFNIAACYEYMRVFDEALKHYRLEHIVDPSDNSVPYRIARVSLEVGDFRQALGAIDSAIRIRSDGENHRLRGRALEGLDRPVDALRSYRRALILDAGDVAAQEGRQRMERRLQSEVGQTAVAR